MEEFSKDLLSLYGILDQRRLHNSQHITHRSLHQQPPAVVSTRDGKVDVSARQSPPRNRKLGADIDNTIQELPTQETLSIRPVKPVFTPSLHTPHSPRARKGVALQIHLPQSTCCDGADDKHDAIIDTEDQDCRDSQDPGVAAVVSVPGSVASLVSSVKTNNAQFCDSESEGEVGGEGEHSGD